MRLMTENGSSYIEIGPVTIMLLLISGLTGILLIILGYVRGSTLATLMGQTLIYMPILFLKFKLYYRCLQSKPQQRRVLRTV